MAVTSTELQGWRDALWRALGSGAKRVTYGDRTVEYRDVAELQAAIAAVDAQIAGTAAARSPFIVTEFDAA